MKPRFVAKLLLLCVFYCFLYISLSAQPVTTVQVGVPTGGTNTTCTAVMYGNGKYVNVQYPHDVFTSPDGVAWTKATGASLPTGNIEEGAFGAGLFVAIGEGGYIATSPDGITWTTRTSGTTVRLVDIKFIQGAFYALTYEPVQTMLRSTDGITWSKVIFGVSTSADRLVNITYGNGVYIVNARSSTSSSLMYRSTTGLSNSWTATPATGPGVQANRVDFIKDKFYMFTPDDKLFTSADGITWSDITGSIIVHQPDGSTSGVATPNHMSMGMYDGSKIYFYGYSGYYGSYGAIYSSTDGTNFTLQTLSAPVISRGVAYVNNKYIHYGGDGFAFSDDGVNYKYAGTSFYGLATNGSTYVGVGYVGERGMIETSTDFSTWTQIPYPNQQKLYAVTWDGSRFLAVGRNTVIESADGATWTEIATPADQFTAVDYGNSLFVAAGTDRHTQDGRIAYSADGATWTTAYTDRGYYFRVRYVNNQFFAMGYDQDSYEALLLYSADGITWSNVTPSPGFYATYYNDIAYTGSKYVVMGADGNGEFFSLTTATPDNASSYGNEGRISSPPAGITIGNWFGETAFAYSGGRIAGMAIDANTTYGMAYIVYSTDGITWHWQATNTLSLPGGITANNNTFRVAGSNDAVFTFTFAATLPVHLIQFKATLADDAALLTWQTATEQNSDYFTVQHSTDKTAWSDIGHVKAAGQSNTLKDYRFTHTKLEAGYHYYRLVQVDKNKQQEISPVRTVQVRSTISVRMYPNPAHGSTLLQLPEASASIITIFNNDGVQVYRRQHSGSTVRLDLRQLSKGAYHVIINQGNKKHIQTLSCQ